MQSTAAVQVAPPCPAIRSVAVVVNPTAGTSLPSLPGELRSAITAHGVPVQIRRTGAVGDARRFAEDAVASRVDLVVAVGGDGTVREVVEGLVASRTLHGPALLVVPAGTGNSNYHAHWGTTPWREALSAVLTGEGAALHRLDLARAVELDTLVLLGSCSGLIAEALPEARTVPLTGPERYRVALANCAARHRPYAGRVLVDGVVLHEGPTVLANVGGGRLRGGTYSVLPDSVLDDGFLDVCVVGGAVDPVDVPELVRLGGHLGHPAVTYGRGRQIVVERTDGEPITIEHDGEFCTTPLPRLTFDVLAGALPVMCQEGRDGLGAP